MLLKGTGDKSSHQGSSRPSPATAEHRALGVGAGGKRDRRAAGHNCGSGSAPDRRSAAMRTRFVPRELPRWGPKESVPPCVLLLSRSPVWCQQTGRRSKAVQNKRPTHDVATGSALGYVGGGARGDKGVPCAESAVGAHSSRRGAARPAMRSRRQPATTLIKGGALGGRAGRRSAGVSLGPERPRCATKGVQCDVQAGDMSLLARAADARLIGCRASQVHAGSPSRIVSRTPRRGGLLCRRRGCGRSAAGRLPRAAGAMRRGAPSKPD